MPPSSASPATAAVWTTSSASTTRARTAPTTRRLPVRFRHPGDRARHGRRRHRADGLRLPPRRAEQSATLTGTSACQPVAGAALLLGQTMIGWRVYDVMRTIDWIETRKELDAKRVGCMGISGGGTCTTFSAALEPRIKAAMISGYLNTFRDSVMSHLATASTTTSRAF